MPESQQNSEEKTFAIPTLYLSGFSRGPNDQLSPPTVWTDDKGSKDARSMELPRGRFQGVRRNIKLAILLHELSDNRFTGYCRILHDVGHMVIVLEEGAIILAEYQGISGDDALKAVFVSREFVIDAELNELNATQLNLALEFNPKSRVVERYHIDPVRPPRIIGRTDESCQPDLSGSQGSIPTPLTQFIDSSLSLRTKDTVETATGPEKSISFEPLGENSVLFETNNNGNKGLLIDVPDLSERWRFMGVTSRENFSV
jgi:hypothetical protein